MVNHHNHSRDTLPHIKLNQTLSGAYGKEARSRAMKVIENKKYLNDAQSYLNDIRIGGYDQTKYSPQIGIMAYIRGGKITWEDLGITEKDFCILVAQK